MIPEDECDCMGWGTDQNGVFSCMDCGVAFREDAAPINPELMEQVRQAQAEHDASYVPNPFSGRQ